MTHLTTAEKYLVAMSTSLIVLSIVAFMVWEINGDRLIEAAYNGQSLPFVNKYVGIHKSIDPANRTLEYFLQNGKPVVPRLLGLLIAAQLLLLVGMRYGRTLLLNFFSQATHAVNLAIFRIVLFAALILYVDIPQVVQFSQFPTELRVAPFGIGWLLNSIPINPFWVTIASYLFMLACIGGLLGFFSRTSAAVAVIIGFYVLGIPQFFGKIDHYHHLLWFAAILAASPCGDVLSVDSFIASRKNNKHESGGSSAVYGLPGKLVMLLMGIIYFFAGVWKFVIGGIGWATGETMKYILYGQWFRLDWTPAFRIDNYPVLYQSAGLGVMVFELAFIFLIFFPRLRKFAGIGGLLFHLSVYLFAHINFWTLGLCYVVFIDFEPLYRRLTGIASDSANALPMRSQSTKPVILIGGSLIIVNILCGIFLIDSWPFAVYPTFASVEEKYIQSLTILLHNPDGTTIEMIPYKEHSFQGTIHSSRLIGLFTQVLWAKDINEVEKRGTALIQVLSEYDPRLRQANSIQLFKDICSVVPGEQNRNPIRRELLLSVSR